VSTIDTVREAPGSWFTRARRFLAEVRNEMGRVTWPTRREVYATTFVVILTSIFFGVYLWAIDILLNRFVSWVFRTLGAA
jgi:preprotein translocase subunit SecE